MKTFRNCLAVTASVLCFLCSSAVAAPSLVEPVTDGVFVVRDDTGQWGGASTGMTHQRDRGYVAKKVIDLRDRKSVV